jgi:diguanylate cyclase (GGDEF)-like protein/PAS domain S-box-containing protein
MTTVVEARVANVLAAAMGAEPVDGPLFDMLRALTSHTPVGVFVSDATGSCRFVNERWCELTGLAPAEALDAGWVDALHPDDRERVEREWAAAAAEERDSVVTYRFLRPDGGVVWIEGYASAFHDGDALVGWVGACVDVTAHRVAAEELTRERELFRVAFEGAPIGMALVGLDGRVLRANEAFCALLGYREDELPLLDVAGITHPDDLRADLDLLEQLVRGEVSSYRIEKRYLRRDCSILWGSLSVSLIRDASGAPVHLVAHVEDIGDRKRVEEELRERAERDPLTGLLNRAAFRRELVVCQKRLARTEEDFALLLLDLDHFKQVNDTLGHQAGDDALLQVAETLRRRLRSADVVARLGGDEFAVLAQTGDATRLADDLLAAVRGCCVEEGGVYRRLSASIGMVAVCAGVEPGTLLATADRALYDAKRGGRGRAACGAAA